MKKKLLMKKKLPIEVINGEVEVTTLKEEVVVNKISKPKVGKLALDFGREDLNKLVSKINEIIDSL